MSRRLTRRAVLRGAGGAAIALPFLPEFMPRASADLEDDIPCRLLTMTFGLGLSPELQAEQFNGPLQALEPFAGKAAMFTNVDPGPLEGSGTPHYRVAAGLFTGVPQQGSPNYLATGPSMEQVMKRALHPGGVPNVQVPELSVGLWSNTGCVAAFTRSWNDDGSPGMRPIRRPTTLFETLFGGLPKGGGGELTPQDLARLHQQRSVLDAVLEDYERYVGPNSPLGARSKARVDAHLSAIRDVETQLAPTEDDLQPTDCGVLPVVRDPVPYSFYDAKSGTAGSGAPQIDWQVAHSAMALIGQLMALGISCDTVRFGSMLSLGAGEYIRFAGDYSAIGDTIDFSQVLATNTAHDVIFHNYTPDAVRLHQHMSLSMLAETLAQMDAIEEPNGRTLLDNSLVLLATEYGENHTAAPAFHAVLGGGDRFNPGWYDQALIPSDVYHQAMAAYAIDSGIPGRWDEYAPQEIAGFRNV